MKTSSSIWLKQAGKFSGFKGWADGYAALTYGWKDKEMIINYIKILFSPFGAVEVFGAPAMSNPHGYSDQALSEL